MYTCTGCLGNCRNPCNHSTSPPLDYESSGAACPSAWVDEHGMHVGPRPSRTPSTRRWVRMHCTCICITGALMQICVTNAAGGKQGRLGTPSWACWVRKRCHPHPCPRHRHLPSPCLPVHGLSSPAEKHTHMPRATLSFGSPRPGFES